MSNFTPPKQIIESKYFTRYDVDAIKYAIASGSRVTVSKLTDDSSRGHYRTFVLKEDADGCYRMTYTKTRTNTKRWRHRDCDEEVIDTKQTILYTINAPNIKNEDDLVQEFKKNIDSTMGTILQLIVENGYSFSYDPDLMLGIDEYISIYNDSLPHVFEP